INDGIKWKEKWENTCSKKECVKFIRKKLSQLEKKSSICNKSYPIKADSICFDISDDIIPFVCTYTGHNLDIYIGMIYLTRKYHDACAYINIDLNNSKKLCAFYDSIGISTNCNSLNIEILWVRKKLFISDNLRKNIIKCVNHPKMKFIIIPLGIIIENQSGAGHANYLIYDIDKKELERFEPHGYNIYGLPYDGDLLNEAIENEFKDIISSDIIYIEPKQFLPKIGFQIIEASEYNRKKIGDPAGFCALWAMWYVDIRLAHRYIPRGKLVTNMINTIKSQNISFKNLIRNYSKIVIDIRDKVLNKAGIDIDDWLNESYNEFQYNVIIDELRSLASVV